MRAGVDPTRPRRDARRGRVRADRLGSYLTYADSVAEPRTCSRWRWRTAAQLRPSNRLVTEPSSKTSLIAWPSSGAIESTVSLSNSCSGRIGSVLVTITSLIRLFFSRSVAGGVSSPCVAATMTSARAGVEQQLGRLDDRAAGVDHVVDQQAAAARDVTDDPVGDDLVGHARVARLVHERDRAAAEPVGPLLGHPHPAGVGRDDGEVLARGSCSLT